MLSYHLLTLLLLPAGAFADDGGGSAGAAAVRTRNGGNCIGVRSCRPRCATFRVDRAETRCSLRTGAFAAEPDGTSSSSDVHPWDTKRFRTYNCKEDGTCMNKGCGSATDGSRGLPADLTIRIGEKGYAGSYQTVARLPKGEDRFTFCSVYPCPKDECALPEQMGFGLRFDLFDSADAGPFPAHANTDKETSFGRPDEIVLGLEVVLKASFVGDVLSDAGPTAFGPLHVEWMDDPTGCRLGYLPKYAPVAPPPEPAVVSLDSSSALFCAGDEYEPAPLPVVASPPPSAFPTRRTMAPTREPTLSGRQILQVKALRRFFDATEMAGQDSRPKHNWFLHGSKTVEDYGNYCEFTGVACDEDGMVTAIDLQSKGLGGALPEVWNDFRRLQVLRLNDNSIGGMIPAGLFDALRIAQVEAARNKIVGQIPNEFGHTRPIPKLRRLLLQYNNLNGTIPQSLCLLNATLFALDVSGNTQLQGTIPECFGRMEWLKVLRVDNIGLVGEVPKGLCGKREMNGLTPNNFGCDAIACPGGTYEPVVGRQTSNETACISCGKITSNVIGSKSCVVLDGNETPTPTISAYPTALPSSSNPSPAPTSAPISTNPTASPSSSKPLPAPTFAPSPEPSANPSILPIDLVTEQPTPSSVSRSVEFSLQLAPIKSLMNFSVLPIFENATDSFILATMPHTPNVHVGVSSVKVMSQSLQTASNETMQVIHSERRTLHAPLRSLQEEEFLTVEMRVEGLVLPRSPPPSFSFEETVLHGFRQNGSQFMNFLANASDFFSLLPQNVGDAAGAVSRDLPYGPLNNRLYFGLLILAIIFCCIVIATYLICREKYFHKHSHQGEEGHMYQQSQQEGHMYQQCQQERRMYQKSQQERHMYQQSQQSPPRGEASLPHPSTVGARSKPEDSNDICLPPVQGDLSKAHGAPTIDVHRCASSTCSQCNSMKKIRFLSIINEDFSEQDECKDETKTDMDSFRRVRHPSPVPLQHARNERDIELEEAADEHPTKDAGGMQHGRENPPATSKTGLTHDWQACLGHSVEWRMLDNSDADDTGGDWNKLT